RSLPPALPPTKPQKPGNLDTSIELPFRLQISPNTYGRWSHATSAKQRGATGRVELWHTRLTTPQRWQKTIRVLWTRDPTFFVNDPGEEYGGEAAKEPFQASLYDDD